MGHKALWLIMLIILPTVIWATVSLQDDPTRRTREIAGARQAQPQGDKRTFSARRERQTRATVAKNNPDSAKLVPHGQIIIEEDSIPDSLLHPRWKIQRTLPITYDDMKQGTADLARPDNIAQDILYNDTIDRYVLGTKMGGTWLSAPVMMSPQEYLKYSEKGIMHDFFRKKNSEIYEQKGKDKFDFSDMHFDLGPAEKIFGPGGVRIKTQGTAELKMGATMKSTDNPSLPVRNRKTTTVDFDEKVNLNLTGKVGDKVNLGLNYNTDATFDFDSQNMKLKYDGKEDEIIKLVEAGNVSFPSNSSLVTGASALFGLRTDMQFGKLKLQTVVSQKKSNSKSVSSKGGAQFTPFEIDVADYEENKHFFLANFFHDNYDDAMSTLPTIKNGVNITRVEIWVTNKSGQTSNTRNIVALPMLGDVNAEVKAVPQNGNTAMYQQMAGDPSMRDIDQAASKLEGQGMVGGRDFEKLEKARLLTSSEYNLNSALGYVSLRTGLQTDQVLAVAYEYTYGGRTYQVGEFSSDITDVNQALFVKSLKNTSNNPNQPNWKLMMKNVYYLANQIEKEKFRLDIKYQSDTSGVYLSYIPEEQIKSIPLIKLLDADRLDNNLKTHSNGFFDFVEGYTVSNGRVFLPKAEPFGNSLRKALTDKGLGDVADKYCFDELYSQTKTSAKQVAEKDKFLLQGQFKGSSANRISLGAMDVPQGSVVVTAGGVTLTEGSDYTVDYAAGEVEILNQSIIDAGTNVNVSLESNTDYGQQRKTMFGVNWEYDFTKDFQMSGTLQHLREQTLTSKVAMGAEPLNNTLWGMNLSWKKESQWLTNVLDKIPFLHVTAPSQIQLTAEFAQLIAGTAGGTQDNASYIDDFEQAKSKIDVSTPSSWVMSSIPSTLSDYNLRPYLDAGFHRARLAWYFIDPLFTRRSSTLTPSHIKNSPQLSNHYVREVYVRELFPNRDQNNYSGTPNTVAVLNLAYYPEERGPYNFNYKELTETGGLSNPKTSWGGMMRKLDTNDFEAANIEYVEFWLLDPFIYSARNGDASKFKGKLRIDLGEVSEDILPDGKKFHESGMAVDERNSYTETEWGKVPNSSTVTYAFTTTTGSRALQDVGYNGLTDQEELTFEPYKAFIDYVKTSGKVTNDSAFNYITTVDPANDNYRYFRGDAWDKQLAPILERYKYINNPQGNSPDSDSRTEAYDTSYKTTPDVEDINQDYTLNEYEKYYEYELDIDPARMGDPDNYCVDKREASVTLRDGTTDKVTWYQYRIPLRSSRKKTVGTISDFTSIRFMRMFLTDFEKPIVLRFGTLDLVRGEWRQYEKNLNTTSANTGEMSVSSVSIEENNTKTPVNYVLPPGISRVLDPTQSQLVENDEQAMSMIVNNMSYNDALAIYRNSTYDLRQYNKLQMFVHANALENDKTNLRDGDLAVFIRLGSDYKSNYYEYEVPLKLTAPGQYSTYTSAGCWAVWPEENMIDINLKQFTNLKKKRNQEKAVGAASYTKPFCVYDDDKPQNKLTVVGNPSLGEVKTMVIGVRNLSQDQKSGEIWVNELRLLDPESSGGWAASGNFNVQLSDFGSLTATGRYVTEGFGGLEEGIMSRPTDDFGSYSVTTNLELGKFFPDKAQVQIPLYYSYTREKVSPKYNPLDTDMRLEDALDAAADKHERDSIESIAVTNNISSNFSLSGVKMNISTKRHPMPYDPANFSFSYSHSHNHTEGETTVYENEDQWHGSMDYSWTPVYKSFIPFKGIKSKAKSLNILKQWQLNWLPQNITFTTDINRNYYELQERDMEDLGSENSLQATFSSQFLWNRNFSIRWDLTKSLHFSFQSATRAEVEEPYTQVNKDLYPDRYEAWKDSVWSSIKHMGTPLDYNQSVTASYQLPLNMIPIFDWVTADASYNSNYAWARGAEQEDGTSFGNTISTQRTLNINSTLNLEKFYDHIPFLKKTNERFRKPVQKVNNKAKTEQKAKQNKKTDQETPEGENADKKDDKQDPKAKALPKNRNTFERELTINADTAIVVTHGKRTKRITVSAKNADGKVIPIKYKVVDDNKISVINKGDSALKMKITVTPKPSLETKTWYRTAQSIARLAMMLRNVSITYRNQYSLALPGFMPNVGDVFGQRRGDNLMSPGLDFAFGAISDNYIDHAKQNGWLLGDSAVASPATISNTEDLQLKATVEPFRNFKIDLNASRTLTRGKSIQYMYDGNPMTQSGSFSMTTISIKSAIEGSGKAENGFKSASFERFCNSLDEFRGRVEAQYAGATYPKGTIYEGKPFSNAMLADKSINTGVDKYSSDVMVPAFLKAYTGIDGLDLFPSLLHMLPNWTIRYSGLSNMTFFQNLFKSVNINHAYKSVYAIGSYSSYSAFHEFMGDLGFVTDNTTGSTILRPSTMFNISQVSINEAFSPLLGVDVTFQNSLTAKFEYKTTRVLNLSMNSVQINESYSHDWVLGFGYKLNDFKFSSIFGGGSRKVKSGNKKGAGDTDENGKTTTTKNTKTTAKSFNHDLNLRLDMSLRDQAAITRDIASQISTASSGNKAFKLSFTADYAVSRMLTMSFYYDHQTNTPLLTSSSYPTTTRDFGLSVKFSLTR